MVPAAKPVSLIGQKLVGSPAPQADQKEKKYQGKPMLDLPKETITLLDLNTWDNFFF